MQVSQLCPSLCDPMDYTVHGILQARILEWVAFSSPGDLPNPGIKPRSPTLQIDSLPAEPQEKPKNTGVGSLSLLQGIFPTQGSNPGLPHCGQILYQLDHKLWKILKEMGIPDHMICLLRNLYAGQEATVRTGHGTTAWFQIGKGVRQGCILSPCLFNLYVLCI